MTISDNMIYIKLRGSGDTVPVRISDITEIYYQDYYGTWEILCRDGTRLLEESTYQINLNRLKKAGDLFYYMDKGFLNIRNINLGKTFRSWGQYDINFNFRPGGYRWGVTVDGGGRYVTLEPGMFHKLRERVNGLLGTSYGSSPYADNGKILINDSDVRDMADILMVEPERNRTTDNDRPVPRIFYVVFKNRDGITISLEEMDRIMKKKYMVHVHDDSVRVPENNRHVDSDLWINVTDVDTRETMKEYQFHDNDFLRRCPICFLTMKNGDRNLAIRITGKMARKLDRESRKRK